MDRSLFNDPDFPAFLFWACLAVALVIAVVAILAESVWMAARVLWVLLKFNARSVAGSIQEAMSLRAQFAWRRAVAELRQIAREARP